ncbi:MAG: hypothetical protein Q7S05_04370 [bacterium]|nr:hypothetical protein [bacterium]
MNALNPGNVSNPLLVQPNKNNTVNPLYPNLGNLLLQDANNTTIPIQGTAQPAQNTQGTISAPQSGSKAGIQVTSTSVTIQAGVRDIGLNRETAGFFGSNAQTGTSPQDLIGRICLVRPWQSSLISLGIPAALFDNACTSKGLQIGVVPLSAPATAAKPATAPVATPAAAKPAVQTAPTGPYVPPQVSIWASPASVPVGSRTSIFWATRGVDACIETSPDGSFNGNSLYGSAATVPISAATIYTISCVAPDGSHVTDSVKVNLAI